MDDAIEPEEEPGKVKIDLVNAYRIHSEQGIEALMAIVTGPLKKTTEEKRRDMVVRVLDLLHRLSSNYNEIASELAPEDEFPDRNQRWPSLF